MPGRLPGVRGAIPASLDHRPLHRPRPLRPRLAHVVSHPPRGAAERMLTNCAPWLLGGRAVLPRHRLPRHRRRHTLRLEQISGERWLLLLAFQ